MGANGKQRRPKGSGSLVYLEDRKKWYMRKIIGRDSRGKKKVVTAFGDSQAQCIKKIRHKEQAWLDSHPSSEVDTMTVAELCRAHLESQIAVTDGSELKEKSIDRRESTIKNQIEKYFFGSLQISEVTPADIEDFITELLNDRREYKDSRRPPKPFSASSIEKALDVINAAFEWALAREIVDKNPVTPVKKNVQKRISKRAQRDENDMDVVFFDNDTYLAFVEECNKKDEHGLFFYDGSQILLVLLYTGMRVGELLALCGRDFDYENRLLTIYKSRSMTRNKDKQLGENNYVMQTSSTKNDKARVIQISEDAANALLELIAQYPDRDAEETIIPETGKFIPNTTNKVEHRAMKIYAAIGLDKSYSGVHLLRHTFATRAFEAGTPVATIAAYIGDLESTTQKHYIAKRRKQIINGESKVFVPLPQVKK